MSRNPLIKKEFVNESKVFFGQFPAVPGGEGGWERGGRWEGGKPSKLTVIPIERIMEKVWIAIRAIRSMLNFKRWVP